MTPDGSFWRPPRERAVIAPNVDYALTSIPGPWGVCRSNPTDEWITSELPTIWHSGPISFPEPELSS